MSILQGGRRAGLPRTAAGLPESHGMIFAVGRGEAPVKRPEFLPAAQSGHLRLNLPLSVYLMFSHCAVSGCYGRASKGCLMTKFLIGI